MAIPIVGMMLASAPTMGSEPFRLDVQELMQRCENKTDNFDMSYCIGYISGISDHLTFLANLPDAISATTLFEMRRMAICGNATYGARVQAFVNWARGHPENWQWPQQFGVAIALREKWPCKPRTHDEWSDFRNNEQPKKSGD